MTNLALLELKNIECVLGEQKIIDGLNLTINQGEFVVLVGANGSGKSTLIKILNGTVADYHGEYSIFAQRMNGLPLHKFALLVSTLTQDLNHATFSDLTVEQNMMLADRRGIFSKKFSSYLANFNPRLADKLTTITTRLSGGERQALALAMCFAHIPQLLLLDEHISALDPKAGEHLMELCNQHIQEKKLTSIMITHNLEHAIRFGTRLIALNHGKIIADISGEKKQNLSKAELLSLAF